MAETDREIRREVTLHARRDEVWQALTDSELAQQWLADDVELDPHEGGEVVLRDGTAEGERRGRVREVVEEERLRIRWRRDSGPETEVEFVLADAAAGTRLIVTESAIAVDRLTAGPRAMTGVGWGDRLFALEVLALRLGALTAGLS